MFLVKVRRDGQITLPTRIRKTLGIKSGDFVSVEIAEEDAILIKLKEIVDKKKVVYQAQKMKQNLVNINKQNPVREVTEEELEAMTDSAKKRVFERRIAMMNKELKFTCYPVSRDDTRTASKRNRYDQRY